MFLLRLGCALDRSEGFELLGGNPWPKLQTSVLLLASCPAATLLGAAPMALSAAARAGVSDSAIAISINPIAPCQPRRMASLPLQPAQSH